MSLTIDIHAEGDIVVFEVDTDEAELRAPLTPRDAREAAVRLMIAADEAEGVER